jgi:hypothetical protein
VSLFFNQEGGGGGGVDIKVKGKEEDAPYRGMVEASDSILHVPGIMDDWKEDIIRQRYDQRISFLKLLTDSLVPSFYSHQLNSTLCRHSHLEFSILRVSTYLQSHFTSLPFDPSTLKSTLDLQLIQLFTKSASLIQTLRSLHH